MNKKLPHENRVVKVDFLFYFRPRNDVRKKNIFQLTKIPLFALLLQSYLHHLKKVNGIK